MTDVTPPADNPGTVAVIGPGCIGRTYAAAAAAAGHRVALCGRTPAEPGLVEVDGHRYEVPGPIVTDPGAVEGPADWVLLTVKAHQTAGAGGWLDALVGPGTKVAVLQNGVEHRERVTPLLPPGTAVVPVVVWDWAEEVEDGLVVVRAGSRLAVPDDEGGRALVTLLDGGFSTVEVIDDFTTAVWRKLLANCVVGLMAIPNQRSRAFRLPGMVDLARRLSAEVVAVAAAEGADLGPADVDRQVEGIQRMPPDTGSSIVYDREAGRALEWDARNAVICRLGRRHGIATPVSNTIVPLLEACDPPDTWTTVGG